MGLLSQLAAEADGKAELLANYRKLLGLVEQMSTGKVNPAGVKVDWINDSWTASDAPVLVKELPAVHVVHGLITEADLIGELQSIHEQRTEETPEGSLLKMAGAEEMIRHLLAKGCQRRDVSKTDADAMLARRNGIPAGN